MNANDSTTETFEQYAARLGVDEHHPMRENARRTWEHEQAVEAFAPTVTPPCPPWCVLPQGHDYTSTDGYGPDLDFQRQHVAFEGPTSATVDATEHNRYGTVTVDAPGVYIYVRGEEHSGEQARARAGELLAAADMLDGITQ